MGGHVLVVEDDDAVRDTTAECLRDAGFDVTTAVDGREALEAMRSQRPCLVLLDLMMPVIDGWQVVHEMQCDPAIADIPVCVISAMANAPSEVDRTLRKPVPLKALLDIVQEYCNCS